MTVNESLGALRFQFPSSVPAGAWAGIHADPALQTYDLTNCGVLVHALVLPDAANTSAVFAVATGPIGAQGDEAEFSFEAGEVTAGVRIGGQWFVIHKQAFDTSKPFWCQMRHENGLMFWETSEDGKCWQSFASTESPFSESVLKAVSVFIGVGTTEASTQETAAAFDDFDLPP